MQNCKLDVSNSLNEFKNNFRTPKPISIRIGYEWAESNPRNDERWKFLKNVTGNILKSLEQQKNARKKNFKFCYQLGRMRAKHGCELISRFVELCNETDILIFDISMANPNVMFEMGVAVAIKGVKSGRVFIMCEGDHGKVKIPSDISGYFITYYKKTAGNFKLADYSGFQAALKTALLDVAFEKQMWGNEKSEINSD